MAVRHPCYRHPRGVWIAGCPDCTAWHRAALADRGRSAGRSPTDDSGAAPGPASTGVSAA